MKKSPKRSARILTALAVVFLLSPPVIQAVSLSDTEVSTDYIGLPDAKYVYHGTSGDARWSYDGTENQLELEVLKDATNYIPVLNITSGKIVAWLNFSKLARVGGIILANNLDANGKMLKGVESASVTNLYAPKIVANTSIGVGGTASAWSGLKGLNVGGLATLSGEAAASAGNGMHLGSNVYWDGTDWKLIVTDEATRYYQHDGIHSFYTAVSGTAGTAPTWTEALQLDANANTIIQNALQAKGANHALGSGTGNAVQPRFGLRVYTTASPGLNDVGAILVTDASSAIATHTSGTHPVLAGAYFTPPTITANGATVTTGATLYLSGAPSGATNNYVLYANAGDVYLAGNAGMGDSTPSYKLDVAGDFRLQGTNSALFGGTGLGDWGGRVYASGNNLVLDGQTYVEAKDPIWIGNDNTQIYQVSSGVGGLSGAWEPGTDNAQRFGNSTKRWSHVYMVNSVVGDLIFTWHGADWWRFNETATGIVLKNETGSTKYDFNGDSYRGPAAAELGPCDAAHRRETRYIEGAPGVADVEYRCMKGANDAYAWKAIATG